MARRREKNFDLPPMMRRRVQKSGRVFFYFDSGGLPRREIPLGSNLVEALKKWADLYIPNDAEDRLKAKSPTLEDVWGRYLLEELNKRAKNTQRDYLRQIKNILQFFEGGPLDEIEPQHIAQYLQWRQSAPIQANREKALISNLFNHSRSWGMTKNMNPCLGVKGYKEKGRQNYVEDPIFSFVMEKADPILRRYMQLLYLTGQRSADIFSMSVHDLSEVAIRFEQGKTGQKLSMRLQNAEGELFELGALIADLLKLREDTKAKADQLFVDQDGNVVTYWMMSQRFRRLRKKLVEQLIVDGKEKMAQEVARYQLRDLRAKAGTDTANASGDIRTAQKQLGHKNLSMTEHYIKNRVGDKVNPTK